MIPARCLTSFNRFQLPSSKATPWLLQPHQGNMSKSWLRDTDSQNGDALLCIYYIKYHWTVFRRGSVWSHFLRMKELVKMKEKKELFYKTMGDFEK